MPTLPEPTITFPTGSRIDLENVYGRIPGLPVDTEEFKAQAVSVLEKLHTDMVPLLSQVRQTINRSIIEAVAEINLELDSEQTLIQRRYSEHTERYEFSPEDRDRHWELGYEKSQNDDLVRKISENSNKQEADTHTTTEQYFSPGYISHKVKELDAATTPEIRQEVVDSLIPTVFYLTGIEHAYATGKLIKKHPALFQAIEEGMEPLLQRLRDHKSHLSAICGNEELANHLIAFYPSDADCKNQQAYKAAFEKKIVDSIALCRLGKEASPVHDQDMVAHVDSQSEFLQKEQNYKALFLRTLSRMLAEQGYDVSAEQLFAKHGEGEVAVFGSQSLLYVNDFAAGEVYQIGQNESTTQYQFYFNFTERQFNDETVTGPVFALDMKAIEQLRSHNVPNAMIEQWSRNFLKMGGMAEHDYVHQATIQYLQQTPAVFIDQVEDEQSLKVLLGGGQAPQSMTGIHLEDHALTLHAQIVKRLFDETPLRKTRVLEWAGDAYNQMHEMQTQALAACKTEEERHNVNEAITYFAEIYSHRLFRVISPEDPALKQPQHIKTSEGPVSKSVADTMDSLRLVTPEHLLEEISPKDGLERLTLHCEDWLGKTYKKIHKNDSFPMVILKESSFETQKKLSEQIAEGNTELVGQSINAERIANLNALQVVKELNYGAAMSTADPQGFLAEAAALAASMREALALRDLGHASEASQIEAQLRKPRNIPAK